MVEGGTAAPTVRWAFCGLIGRWLLQLCVGIFRAIFHLWRHATLYDGALRLMPPAIHS
jgi:hypothetical protein